MIHITLIRHGHTDWNTGDGPDERFRGLLDLPLAETGVAQARLTADRLSAWPLAAVYSSHLQRALHTAEIIAAPHRLPVQTLPGLSSMNYGHWAGRLHADVAQNWPDLYAAWRQDPFSVPIPGGETTAALRGRAVDALRTALACHSNGDTILFVTHQVVAKVLVCALAGLPGPAYWRVRQDLCNLSRFDYDPATGAFAVAGLNDACHLTPAVARPPAGGAQIFLLRHGQTGWNAGAGPGGERFRGRTDLPLDNAGLAQARALAAWWAAHGRGIPVAAVYTSPLLRARQTVEPLAAELGLAIQSHPGLLDINYGSFQGLTHAEAASLYPDLYQQWRAEPGRVRFPQGESLADLQARVTALLNEMADAHPRERVVLVGHEIVNKVLACALLGLGLDQIWRIQQRPACLNLFQHTGGQWHLHALNDDCHLPPL